MEKHVQLTFRACTCVPMKNALRTVPALQQCSTSKPLPSTWSLVCQGFQLLQHLLQCSAFSQVQFL